MGFLIVVFLSAFLSFVYELAIAQTMVFLTADALVWYALVGGIFLGSMGLGALWSATSGMGRSPVRSLVLLNCLQALIGGTSIILLYVMYQVTMVSFGSHPVMAGGAVVFFVAFLGAAGAGLLAGAGLPLLIETGRRNATSSEGIAVVFHLGLLVAGIAFPFVFVPHLSAFQISLGAGVAGVVVALALSWSLRDEKDLLPGMLSAALIVVLGVLLWQAPAIEMFFAEKYYAPKKGEASWKDVVARSGDHVTVRRYYAGQQQIDLVRFPPGGEEDLAELMAAYRLQQVPASKESGWGLFVNGTPRVLTDFADVYNETFAHVPLAALAATPKHILILGGGDGFLARELLKLRSVEKIIVVDDVGMKRVFGKEADLRKLQETAFKAKQVQVVEADVFDFVRRDKEVYDAIYLDLPYPLEYDGSKLFSYEFFRFLKMRLAPQGFLVISASGFFQEDTFPLPGSTAVSSKSVFLETIKQSGFETVVPFFSRLEDDNPAALAVMQRLSNGEEGADKEMLREYVNNLASGFLLALPRRNVVFQNNFSSPVSLNILNAARFRLSLDAPVSFTTSGAAFNTIFSPQLPRPGSCWKIRYPY